MNIKQKRKSLFLLWNRFTIRLLVFLFYSFFCLTSLAQEDYKPYFEIGGAKYFSKNSNLADRYDIFVPLLQKGDSLFFTDLRMFGRSSSSYEGSAHFGVRKLYPDEKKMFGLYASFDFKWTDQGNLFKQVMIGGEHWNDKWFIGGNVYQPLDKTKKFIGRKVKQESRLISIVDNYEYALSGADAELGYSLTEELTIYAGGYYFFAKDAKTTTGPKMRITYRYSKNKGRILDILDGVGIEVGGQYDKPRGATVYIGIKLKIGLTDLEKNSNVSGFERHMIDLVRRDPDIVIGKSKQKFYYPEDKGFQNDDRTGDIEKPLRDDLEELLKSFGLPKNASKKDVKEKYRKHILSHHPDRCIYLHNKNKCTCGLEEKMSKEMAGLNSLYEVISERIF